MHLSGKKMPWLVALMVLSAPAQAAEALDDASNYGGTWTDGSNGGTGFGPWSISSNNNGGPLFAGVFLGDSSNGAGNLNTLGVSFGMYANPTAAFVSAARAFAAPLGVGESFRFQFALNYDNGNKGFNLYAGAQGEVLNFNVGSGGSVSSSNATLTPSDGAGYNYGGSDAVLSTTITQVSLSSIHYEISRASSQGFQGVLFSGTVSGLTEPSTGFGFYVTGTDGGGAAENNLYFNQLSVTPPSGGSSSMAGASSLGSASSALVGSSGMTTASSLFPSSGGLASSWPGSSDMGASSGPVGVSSSLLPGSSLAAPSSIGLPSSSLLPPSSGAPSSAFSVVTSSSAASPSSSASDSSSQGASSIGSPSSGGGVASSASPPASSLSASSSRAAQSSSVASASSASLRSSSGARASSSSAGASNSGGGADSDDDAAGCACTQSNAGNGTLLLGLLGAAVLMVRKR